MTESTLFAPQVGAALSLLEHTRTLEENPPVLNHVESVELLVRSALQQATILQLAWSICTKEGSVWETGWFLQRVRAIELLTSIVADILDKTRDFLIRLRKDHPDWTVPATTEVDASSSTVREIAAGVRNLLARLNRPRPPANEAMIGRSRESIARGEIENIGDMIARLESGGTLVRE